MRPSHSDQRDTGRVLFFGTPDFAVPTLEALCRSGRRPARVIAQPARRAGRGRKLVEPPVAVWARESDLEVVQPARVRDPDFIEEVAALAPDVAVVVAFGQIFPRELVELPRLGCVNLHASLLPRHRGAAPIQAAIAAGDERTGVTTMLMEEGLDTGPMLLVEETPIGPDETAAELSERLARIGGELMVETLERLERGEIEPVTQDDGRATYAPRIRKEDGRVDWGLDAREIYARFRAYQPWPGLTTTLRQEPLKITGCRPLGVEEAGGEPGRILGAREGALAVVCGDGVLGLTAVQRPGRRAVDAADFARGERLEPGERLG
jgi:methionyl-tRNA formyltransferase